MSNTYNFLKNKKWSGILFEADMDRCLKLQSLYADRSDIICVNSMVELSGQNSLGELLVKNNVSHDVDFITIDIDGADYHVWKGIGTDYQPRVVCIEFNPTVPNDVFFVQEADTRIQQGSSLLALTELGEQLGYTLVATTVFNAIFLRNDFLPLIPQYDRSVDALHTARMSSSLFQTYDGELKLLGTKKLLWHRIAINPQRLQVLSKKNRQFPFAPTWDAKVAQLHALGEGWCAVLERPPAKGAAELIELEAHFQQLLAACAHLLPVQFLEGVVLQTLSESLLWLDAQVSALVNGAASSHPENQNRWVAVAHALHGRCSELFERRADQLVRSGSCGEVKEWLLRSLHVLRPHLCTTVAQTALFKDSAIDIKSWCARAKGVVSPALRESLALRSAGLRLKVAREALLGGDPLETAHYLQSGWDELCDLTCANTPPSETSRAQIAAAVQGYLRLHRKYSGKFHPGHHSTPSSITDVPDAVELISGTDICCGSVLDKVLPPASSDEILICGQHEQIRLLAEKCAYLEHKNRLFVIAAFVATASVLILMKK